MAKRKQFLDSAACLFLPGTPSKKRNRAAGDVAVDRPLAGPGGRLGALRCTRQDLHQNIGSNAARSLRPIESLERRLKPVETKAVGGVAAVL